MDVCHRCVECSFLCHVKKKNKKKNDVKKMRIRTHKSSTLPCKCHNINIIVNASFALFFFFFFIFVSFVPFNFVVVGFSSRFCHHSLSSSAFWLFEFLLFCSIHFTLYLFHVYHFHLLSLSHILCACFFSFFFFCFCVSASLCIHHAILIIIMTVINMQIYFVVLRGDVPQFAISSGTARNGSIFRLQMSMSSREWMKHMYK